MFGDAEIYISEGSQFIDVGFVAKDSGVDINDYVTTDNPVDTSYVGTYTVTYTLDYHDEVTVLTRTVHVQYLNSSCNLISGTDTLECYKNWSSYLHTVVTVKIYFNQYENINSLEIFNDMEDIISLYHQLSDKYDTYDGYINIKTINDDPTTTHTITPELFDLIDFTIEHQDDVNNLFNAALGPVLQIWHDYRENCTVNQVCEVPPMQDLLDAEVFTDPDDIILDSENYTIKMNANMSLDLGGVSKGYISGELIEYLDSLDLDGYLINNGESNISIGGTHPTRESGQFLLAITDPTYTLPYYATVYLNAGDQLVTSGDYQQYYMVGETLYHHIINNTTLMPERNSRSVSIIFSNPALADLYSTAIFIMTIEEGQTFVNGIDGLEAIWYGMDGTIYYSENFEEMYLHNIY
jgi:thiamine biosynthesis lipoprotein